MKRMMILFGLVSCLAVNLKAQSVSPSQLKIMCNDTSLVVSNADTSYIFNAYILTPTLGGVNTVTMICQNYSPASQWTTVKDTVYSWSQVVLDTPTSIQHEAFKLSDNILVVCLGRLYYTTRHKFIFIVNGNNGLLTREFIF